LISKAKKNIHGDAEVYISSNRDKPIVKDHDLKVLGTITASGGVILMSKDHQISIDCTFEGILKRDKDAIRVHVGRLLFEEE
jgi:vacuolar-type H+-ATPase subunit E/Vma4